MKFFDLNWSDLKAMLVVSLAVLAVIATAQATDPGPAVQPLSEKERQEQIRRADEQARKRQESIRAAEANGISVEAGAIGGFRGARSNVIMGYGIVVGLNGTGDSKQVEVTSIAMSNAISRWGTVVDPKNFRSKNIAIVSVTAELPPFAAPGRKIDITVQSLGDCKSLEGGVLLPTPLATMTDYSNVYAMAAGAVSIGGFNAGGGGNSVRKNHPTVGRVPEGADIQKSVPTQFVFNGNTLYYDLDNPDFTTVKRTADKIQETFPGLGVQAVDAVTIAITIPSADDAVSVISQIQKMEVMANSEPTVVINERTGTIVIGGNVRLGPALIAHGSLRVQIETEFITSQPGPFSNGETTIVPSTRTGASEDAPEVVVVAPNATLDDLAKIFQAMDVSARDIIAILQALADQGALKARIRIQ